MARERYLSAREAAQELGISLPTLYAYVSRGLIRSETGDDSRRTRRYHADDVRKLKDKAEQRRDPTRGIEKALHWGLPVLESALTLIDGNHVYYRGRDVAALAAGQRFEQVAAWLWQHDEDKAASDFERARGWSAGALPGRVAALIAHLPYVEAFQVALATCAAEDAAAYDLRPAAVAQTGARILWLMLTAATRAPITGQPSIAQTLQQVWAPRHRAAVSLFDTALILCADHELNVSSFTARCVASAASTPYAAVIAGLAALQGAKHGGHTARVDALLREMDSPGQAARVLGERLKRGEPIPGFGHALYPSGDPRAKVLLNLLRQTLPKSNVLRLADGVQAAALDLIGEHPTIDFALVTLARALGLPAGSPLAIFALGRTAGWIAHAIEQYQVDKLIRPRARYIGPLPRAE